jgi:hypothetical protein
VKIQGGYAGAKRREIVFSIGINQTIMRIPDSERIMDERTRRELFSAMAMRRFGLASELDSLSLLARLKAGVDFIATDSVGSRPYGSLGRAQPRAGL